MSWNVQAEVVKYLVGYPFLLRNKSSSLGNSCLAFLPGNTCHTAGSAFYPPPEQMEIVRHPPWKFHYSHANLPLRPDSTMAKLFVRNCVCEYGLFRVSDSIEFYSRMDHLHYRLNFDLDKNFITA